MAPDVIPRLAATTILVRPQGAHCEVLLLKRGAGARFMPNAYVFAGGALDAQDANAETYALCEGLDDRAAAQQLGLQAEGLKFFVAAIREVFEESGLLLAYDAHARLVDLSQWDAAKLREMRLALSSGAVSFAALCQAQGWRLAVDRLHFFSHWITPPGRMRFDTRFFLGAAPANQMASLVGDEMSELLWRSPAEALAAHAARKLLLMYPTRMLLKEIDALQSFDALFAFAREARRIEPVTPVLPPDAEP
jgi:8-oxo-dGTP pyrophosphatase MutT (NUDIX family)